ncbi:MAG TPA: OsmC family protein [Pseudogracilibacillus sp.]|nr:OsmC family protein [Pseudogracilibacillus sp.]
MKFTWKEDHMETTAFNYDTLHISPDDTKGFRPFQLLVASIASCSGGVFHKIITKQRTEYDSLTIDAEVERNEAVANRVEKISLHFTITGSNLNEEKMQRNLEISRKNCSMVQSVQDSIVVEEDITVINK